jgi:carbon-monoxide dehydrogenase small subunit
LWQALQDPVLVASCVPGASITSVAQNHVAGAMDVAFGPIKGQFTGRADVTYGEYEGSIIGQGQDRISKTRLTASADFSVIAIDAAQARLDITITYSLRGALAQFARGPIVAAFADEIAAMIGANLQARLTGTVMQTPTRLSPVRLLGRIIWRRLKNLFQAKP